MKKAVLLFPDSISIAQFIHEEKVSHAEVYSNEKILVAPMEDEQIVKAELIYKAVLKVMTPQN
jgi:hypothetical protein